MGAGLLLHALRHSLVIGSMYGPSPCGADDGHIYVWARDGRLLRWLRGDTRIVNCLAPNPAQPLVLATSGATLAYAITCNEAGGL